MGSEWLVKEFESAVETVMTLPDWMRPDPALSDERLREAMVWLREASRGTDD